MSMVLLSTTRRVLSISMLAYGQAFYNDGTGTIVNYGTICTFGVCQSGNEYNNTDDFTSLIYTGGDTITRSGETLTLNKSAAVTDKLAGNVVNHRNAFR